MPLIRFADDGPRGTAIGFVLSPERLITVRFAPSRIFDTYAEQVPRGSAAHDTGAHVFVGFMLCVALLRQQEREGLMASRVEFGAIEPSVSSSVPVEQNTSFQAVI